MEPLQDISKNISIKSMATISAVVLISVTLLGIFVDIAAKGYNTSSDKLNMLGYFYSTVAQSIAAIIALFGLFATFRIQYSNIQKEDALQSLRNYIRLKCFDPHGEKFPGYDYVDSDVQCWLDKDVPAHLREIIVKGDTASKSIPTGFYDYYLFINSIEFFAQHLIKRLVQFMVISGAFLVLNIVALQTYNWPLWSNSFVIASIIVFFALILVAVIFYTRDSLKGPNFIFINNNETNKPGSQVFSILAIEKIMKEVMKKRNLDKIVIERFKACI